MKRILALVLTICVCASLALSLSSCKQEHEHVYSSFWTFDDENHWHDCEGNCGSFIDKAPHDWGEGVVTQEADEETVGILSYRCKVCGKEKTEKFSFDPSNGPTTTVREDQMKRAFDVSHFRNVTMTFFATNSGAFAMQKVYLFTEGGTYWYELDENGVKLSEEYDVETQTGYDVYTKGEDGKWYVESMTKQHFAAKYVDFAARFSRQYTVFAENYGKFTYSEADREYQLFDEIIASNNIDYATLRFEAKKLIFLEFVRPIGESLDFTTETYGNYQSFAFANYGSTSFELPKNAIQLR